MKIHPVEEEGRGEEGRKRQPHLRIILASCRREKETLPKKSGE